MSKKSVRLALAGLALTALPLASPAFVTVGVSINIAPPPLPVYEQPPCPAVGYIWTPGYWAWDDEGYYWVPGTWIAAPTPGYLWTPGYWGWGDGIYVWHAGYWGPHVGFYGGVNYGFGYGGVGFEGGYWRGNAFYYNRAVSNLGGVHVTNVYNRTVINNVTINRVSYNGGNGGIQARPNRSELTAEHERHVDFTSAQRQQEHLASTNHDLRASVNEGKPRIAATSRPGVFTGHEVQGARAAGGPMPVANHGPTNAGPGHGGGEGPNHGAAEVHNDRPPGATGGMNHPGPQSGHSGPTNGPAMARTSSPQQHFGGPAADVHQQPQQHAGGSAQEPHPQSQQHFGGNAQEPHPQPQQHFNAPPQHSAGPQEQPHSGAPQEHVQAQPHGGPPGGGAPPGGGPPGGGQPQPHPQSAPRPQQNEHHGGGEPRHR